MGADEATLAGLPEPGEPIFYPKVGHCIFRGVIQDRAAPGTELVELEDIEEGSRILIPLARVPELNLRPAGAGLESIQEELSAQFEEPYTDDEERRQQIEELITEGSPRSLARALKRLHFLRQTAGLSREEEQTRKKVRSWLAAEVSISKECTRAEAQAFMTRVLQDTMSAHKQKEKEEAKERRRAAKEQKKAESLSARSEPSGAGAGASPSVEPVESDSAGADQDSETEELEIEGEVEPETETESETETDAEMESDASDSGGEADADPDLRAADEPTGADPSDDEPEASTP